MRCAMASTLVQRICTFSVHTALSASSRLQLLSWLPAARVRSISPPGRNAASPQICRASSAALEAFRSFSITSRVFRPAAAVRQASSAASVGFTPVRTVICPGFAASSASSPGILSVSSNGLFPFFISGSFRFRRVRQGFIPCPRPCAWRRQSRAPPILRRIPPPAEKPPPSGASPLRPGAPAPS